MSHPVIHLRLGGSGRGTYKKTKKRIAKKIAKEYRRHRYLLDSPSLSKLERKDFIRLANGKAKGELLISSLDWLSTLLAEHHGFQTVILIDEYDAPIVDGYLNGYRKKIVSFYRSWLTDALKDTDDLFLSALSGVLRPVQESIFSELNNVNVNTMLDETYGEAFGFTEDEVQALAAYIGQFERAEEMRAWYDGYQSGPSRVYNPWSVTHYLGSGVAQAYWVNTSKNGIVRQLVREADETTSLELAHIASGGTLAKPLDMQTVFDDLAKSPGTVWPQLYQAGYVTTDDTGLANDDMRPRRLRLPNLEVRRLFVKELIDRAGEVAGSDKNLKALHAAVRGTDEDALEGALRQIMLDSPSFHDLAGEGQCHMLPMGLLYGMEDYRPPTSNRESGDGRADVLLEPEPEKVLGLPAVVIEVKRPKDDKKQDLGPEALKAHGAPSRSTRPPGTITPTACGGPVASSGACRLPASAWRAPARLSEGMVQSRRPPRPW